MELPFPLAPSAIVLHNLSGVAKHAIFGLAEPGPAAYSASIKPANSRPQHSANTLRLSPRPCPAFGVSYDLRGHFTFQALTRREGAFMALAGSSGVPEVCAAFVVQCLLAPACFNDTFVGAPLIQSRESILGSCVPLNSCATQPVYRQMRTAFFAAVPPSKFILRCNMTVLGTPFKFGTRLPLCMHVLNRTASAKYQCRYY